MVQRLDSLSIHTLFNHDLRLVYTERLQTLSIVYIEIYRITQTLPLGVNGPLNLVYLVKLNAME